MTLTPDKKEKLKQTIAGMKSICSEGRKEVTTLIEALIGEPLTPPWKDISITDLRRGDVYSAETGFPICLLSDFNGHWFITGREVGPKTSSSSWVTPFSDVIGIGGKDNSVEMVAFLNDRKAKRIGHIVTTLVP